MKKRSALPISTICQIVSAILLLQSGLFSQEKPKPKDFESMSLEDMLNVKITVASQKSLTSRESPGIVTVITQEEIVNSGARDLTDVLMLVPGYALASDVQNTVGIGIRGSWAHEGKVLLLLDGQEFNETLYSTLQLGNHFPLESVKRIEIIRGPGSAIYGGNAELGVINIVTKSAADINGVSAAVAYGQMSRGLAQRTISLSAGKQLRDFSVVAHTFFGQGNRSDREYTDVYGNTFDMMGNSSIDPLNFNVGLGYKGLSTRLIVDRYHETTRDLFDLVNSETLNNDFNSLFLEAKYDLKIGNRFTLTPRFNYKSQSPWQCVSESCIEPTAYYGKTAERIKGNLALSYDVNDRVNLLVGGEFYNDRAHTRPDAPPEDLFSDGERSVSYDDQAFFIQGLIKSSIADLTAGARVEHHSLAGYSVAPRFGLTKVKGRFHAKVLVSGAFRAPSIENFNLSPAISPERTTVMEFETGFQATKNSILTGNVFASKINKPIVYSYDVENDVETYQNFGGTGTRGFELDYRVKKDWGYAFINYSFYRSHDNQVDYYSVDNLPHLLLGFPAHKVAAVASFKFAKRFALNPSAVFLSERYGYAWSTDGENTLRRFAPSLLTNMNFTWRDFGSKGVDLAVGVYDIFAQNLEYIQPYKGSHAPLPGPSREVRIRLAYRWSATH